jgi:hypothetical protein
VTSQVIAFKLCLEQARKRHSVRFRAISVTMDSCDALLKAINTAREVMALDDSPRRHVGIVEVELANGSRAASSTASPQMAPEKMHDLLAELDTTRKASRRRIGGLQNQLTQAKTHQDEQTRRIADLEATVENQRADLAATRTELVTAQSNVTQLRGQLEALECRDVVAELAKRTTALASTKEKLRDAEVKLATADVKLAEMQSLVFASSGDDRLAILRQQVHELSTENVSRDRLLEAKEALLVDLRNRLQQANDERSRALMDLDRVRHESTDLHQEIVSLSGTLNLKDSALADARSQAREAHSLYHDSLAQRDVDEAQAMIREENNRQILNDMRREVAALKADIEFRDSQLLRLQRQLSEYQHVATAAEDQRVMAHQARITARNLLSQQLQQASLNHRARVAFQNWLRHSVNMNRLRAESVRIEHTHLLATASKQSSAREFELEALWKSARDDHSKVKADAIAHAQDMEFEVETLLRRITELEAENKRIEARSTTNKTTDTEVTSLRNALAEAQAARERDRHDGKLAIDRSHAEIARLIDALAAERASTASAIAERDVANRKLQEDLQAARRSHADGQRTINDLRSQVAAVTALCHEKEAAVAATPITPVASVTMQLADREVTRLNGNEAAGDGEDGSPPATGIAAGERTANMVLLELRATNAEAALATAQDEISRLAREVEELQQRARDAPVTESAVTKSPPPTDPARAATNLAAIAALGEYEARIADQAVEIERLQVALQRAERRRKLEASALKDLLAGLEASHVDEVRHLVATAVKQQEASVVSAVTVFEQPDRKIQVANRYALRSRAVAQLKAATTRQLRLRFLLLWAAAASRRRAWNSVARSSVSVEQLNASLEKVTALASAAIGENKRLLNARPSSHAATQTRGDEDIAKCKAQLLELHDKARISSEIMGTARDQLAGMANELRATKEREKVLAVRVRELSTALDAEAMQTRKLKEEFISFLSASPNGGNGDESPGIHVHSVPPRRS